MTVFNGMSNFDKRLHFLTGADSAPANAFAKKWYARKDRPDREDWGVYKISEYFLI
jgi:hypothetical protein